MAAYQTRTVIRRTIPPQSPLSIERAGRGSSILRVVGELDLTNHWLLADELLRAEREAAGPLVIDVGAVEFVDAGGLRVLLHAAQRARKRGAHLALKEPGALLRRLLNLTGLDRTIVVLPPGSP